MSLERRRAASAQVLVADPARPDLSAADRHHLATVLRLRAGEPVVATDGAGRWAPCRYGAGGCLEPDGDVEEEPRAEPSLTVAFAPVKGERAEWVVQKLTELGIDDIVVLATARSVVRWTGTRRDAAMDRLARVAAEALCQSRRVWLPRLAGPVPLGALDGAALAEPGAAPLRAGTTAIAVGPEGGWAPEELALGWPAVGLAGGILRAETAAVAAGSILGAARAGTLQPRWED